MTTKTCSKCNKEYPATIEYFYINNKNKDKLHNWCKNCQKEYDLNRSKNKDKIIQRQNLASKQMKECIKCKQIKQYSDFNKDSNKSDGLSSVCKECDRLSSQEYRNKYPEYYKSYYAEKHKEEKEREIQTQIDLANRGMRVCNLCHKELPITSFGYGGKSNISWCNDCYRKYKQEYAAKNKEKKREYDKNRRHIKRLQDKEYRKTHKEQIKQYQIDNADRIKAYNKQRYRNNKIGKLISNAMCSALKGNKAGQHWEDLVPYTLEQLRTHLESQFTPKMNWNNYGDYWEVDHIIPQNVFNYTTHQDRDFQICWSLANLRPLEKCLNRQRSKDGSDIPIEIKNNIMKGRSANDCMRSY